MEALEARGLSKTFDQRGHIVRALDDFNLIIHEGQLFSVLGRNGAGKTTFLKIASTLLLPTSGTLSLFGHDAISAPKEVRALIAMVPQEGKLFYHITPRELVREYLRIRGASRETAVCRTDEVLEAMGLTAYGNTVAFQLSGGLRQRALVAMILATRAPFLFLDEPTLGMDPFARRQVWEVIRNVARQGSTVLFTTHYLDEAEELSDELAVIERGRLMFRGSSETLRATVGREVRLQFSTGFKPEELSAYGKVYTGRNHLTLLTSRSSVRELTELALTRGIEMTVGPVTLEEAFLELVGKRIEEE